MNLSKLDAFKAKANSVLMAEALLHVNGGQVTKTDDPEFCHVGADGCRIGKNEQYTTYSQCQLDHFFANSNLTGQFDSMYERGNVDLANKRAAFMDEMLAQG
jgi:hypothetical protein